MDQEFWGEFIELYRSHPCLWYTKCHQYNDRQFKAKAYGALVKKCRQRYKHADKEFVAKKINGLRCNFRRQHKKVLEYQRQGIDFTPNLWYYGLMVFLADENVASNELLFSNNDITKDLKTATNDAIEEKRDHIPSIKEEYLGMDMLEVEEVNLNGNINANSKEELKKSTKVILKTEDEYDSAGRILAFDLRGMDRTQQIIAEKIFSDVVAAV